MRTDKYQKFITYTIDIYQILVILNAGEENGVAIEKYWHWPHQRFKGSLSSGPINFSYISL